jgi:hypothetical protein
MTLWSNDLGNQQLEKPIGRSADKSETRASLRGAPILNGEFATARTA